jgi:hypothetical protein
LGFLQRRSKVDTRLRHPREDVVARAVDHAARG